MNSSQQDDDVSGYFPQSMICRGKAFQFDKERWTVVLHCIIQLIIDSVSDWSQEYLYLKITNGDNRLAEIGNRTRKGNFIVPERNGWHYIPEKDISVRHSTSNIMLKIIRRLIVDTHYENKIVLVVKNKDGQMKYIHV